MQRARCSLHNGSMSIAYRWARVRHSFFVISAIAILLGVWLANPVRVDDATLSALPASPTLIRVDARSRAAAAQRHVPVAPDLRELIARIHYARQIKAQQAEQAGLLRQAKLNVLHSNLALHGVGSQLYTAWNTPMTLKAMNWYGFEYAPFVPDGLDKVPLDTILASLRNLGFNALRITFANETVESNPVVTTGLDANPGLQGLHSLDIMQRIIARAHHFGIRVILCNSRSEAGRGPELLSGLWYTNQYPQTSWATDWEYLVRRLGRYSSFVGADLRNEPHVVGSTSLQSSVFNNGPLWGAFQGTYYHDRDWRYAAQTLGNQLLAIDPHLLIIVEGVQIYLDPDKNALTGGLWGSNLIGVQYDPIVLNRPSQLVYSVHEYGPQMWQGAWFTPKTSYASLENRWNSLWGYILSAHSGLRAPIFVGEFGTCHEYYSCVASDQGWKQGFWFQSFVRYLASHPQVGWAYWALNPTGPFQATDDDFYSLFTQDWHHYYPMITYGLAKLLQEPTGLWNTKLPRDAPPPTADAVAEPGCLPGKSCTGKSLQQLGDVPSPSGGTAAVPIAPPPNKLFQVQVQSNVPYVQPTDGVRTGDLYLPQSAPVGQRPAVVILHGGTWSDGAKGQPGTVALARGFAQNGYVAFDIDYRLTGKGGNYPGDVQDVKDAVAFLVANHARYGIDVRRLALVGAGAGAQLAMLVGYASNVPAFVAPHYPNVSARIGAVASFFGPADLKKLVLHGPDPAEAAAATAYIGKPYAADPKTYAQASPETYLPTAVSTIIFEGDSDKAVSIWQPFDLYRALRQDKVPSKFVDVPGAPAGFEDLSPGERAAALSQTVAFFDTVFYKPTPAT